MFQTIEEVRVQASFLRWYIKRVRELWQTDATGDFGRVLKLCVGLLDGEPNVLGIYRLVELFGLETVEAAAVEASRISAHGVAKSVELTGRERTTGGILFYLVRQRYEQEQEQEQEELALKPEAEVNEGETAAHSQTPVINSSPTTASKPHWTGLKIPYLLLRVHTPQTNATATTSPPGGIAQSVKLETSFGSELIREYKAEIGNYVALEQELCQIIRGMTRQLSAGESFWDEVSFRNVAQRIFGTTARRTW
jgi:PHAX RNA-binding domain